MPAAMHTRNRFLSTTEAAQLLDESGQNVRRRCEAGQLEALRIGRNWKVERADVQRVLDGEKQLPPVTANA